MEIQWDQFSWLFTLAVVMSLTSALWFVFVSTRISVRYSKIAFFQRKINEFEVRVCIGSFMSAKSFLPLTQFLKHLQSGAKSSSDGCIFRFPSKNPFEIACHLDLDLQLRWKTALKSLPYLGYNGGATLAEARRRLRPRLARRWDAK